MEIQWRYLFMGIICVRMPRVTQFHEENNEHHDVTFRWLLEMVSSFISCSNITLFMVILLWFCFVCWILVSTATRMLRFVRSAAKKVGQARNPSSLIPEVHSHYLVFSSTHCLFFEHLLTSPPFYLNSVETLVRCFSHMCGVSLTFAFPVLSFT